MLRSRGYLYVAVIVLFLGYITLQSRAFLFPPSLTVRGSDIVSLKVGQEYTLQGSTDRFSQVKINGEAIPLDLEGNFLARILVQKGVASIEVSALSRFGNERKKIITLIGKE